MKPKFARSGSGHSRMGCDTYISTMGGVSEGEAFRLSQQRNPSSGPDRGLVIVQADVDHDGEPATAWAWLT